MADNLFLGARDAFLVKFRADYDAVSEQGDLTLQALENANLVGSNPDLGPLFLEVSNTTEEGDRAVWRYTYTTMVTSIPTRHAGAQYEMTDFAKGYETAVYDPDNQLAPAITVPEERQMKESSKYTKALDRAKKLQQALYYANKNDPFEVFNFSFTAPASYPAAALNRFFAKGNYDALNEPLISTLHASKIYASTQSNAVRDTSNNALAFGDTAFWTARQQAYTFKDDVGRNMPMLQGKIKFVAPNASSIIRTAAELNMSDWKIGTSDNEINIHQNEQAVTYSNPILLQSQYSSSLGSTPNSYSPWWMIDNQVRDTEIGSGFVKITFVPYSAKIEWEQSIDSAVYKVKEEFVYGWCLWQTAVGSPGNGASYTS